MDTHSFLSKLCSSRNVFAGFSLSFNGLDSLFPYYRQSLRSAALSKTTHTSYIFAQDYLTDFIRDACSSIHDVRAYIHPDVSTLVQLDTSEGEDLVHTFFWENPVSGPQRNSRSIEIHFVQDWPESMKYFPLTHSMKWNWNTLCYLCYLPIHNKIVCPDKCFRICLGRCMYKDLVALRAKHIHSTDYTAQHTILITDGFLCQTFHTVSDMLPVDNRIIIFCLLLQILL